MAQLPAARLVTSREWRLVLGLTLAVVLLAGGPYLLAYRVSGGYEFAGILLNPLDGQSYFAKMQAGWRGSWLFTLPYTAEPGPGVFLFTYYLFLGHLARWTGASLDLVYHLARSLSGVFLLLLAYRFIARFFPAPRVRLGAWLVYALGSGLGWAVVRLGRFTSDLWVAEAIPFLSVFSNSHFCLAAGLMLWIFELTLPGLAVERPTPGRLALAAGLVTLLAQVQPMVLLTLGVVVGGAVVGRAVVRRAWVGADWLAAGIVGVFALPWLVYDFALTFTHPSLAGWNAQNLTPSPPVWDALVSGGVPLLLALPGIGVAARRRSRLDGLVLLWFGLNVILLYAPLALQRRFSLGLWMPVTILAVTGWQAGLAPRLPAGGRRLVLVGLAGLTVGTNLLVYAAALSGIGQRAPQIFLTRAEAAALRQLPAAALVLAAPETSLFIPARSEARVVYGHPYETVNADARRQLVTDFYAGRLTLTELLASAPVNLIFYGPREKQLGALPPLPGWRIVFQQEDVTLYGR